MGPVIGRVVEGRKSMVESVREYSGVTLYNDFIIS